MNIDAPVTDEELQAYADDELEQTRRLVVIRYIEHNAEAAKKVEAIIAQTTLVRAASAPLLNKTIPRHLRVERLFGRERNFLRRMRVAWGAPWSAVAAAFVGIFILGAASGWGLHGGIGLAHHGFRPLVEEAADTYTVYEPDRLHPVEISATNRDELMSWASSRLGRSISAPETLANFKLLGGRVVATSRGPAAMFMYDDKHGRRIVMLICPLSLHGTAPLKDSSPDGLSGVSWSRRGVGYSLVGPLTGEDLHALGELARHQMADKA